MIEVHNRPTDGLTMVRQSLLNSNVDDVGPQVDPDDKGEFTEAQLTANFVCKISLISSSHPVPNIRRYYNVSHMCCTRRSQAKEKNTLKSEDL